MKKDRVEKKYNEIFSRRMQEKTISQRLLKMGDDPDTNKLRELFCNQLLRKMTLGDFDCSNLRKVRSSELFKLYDENVNRLLQPCNFHMMVHSCYTEEKKEFYRYFNKLIKDIEQSGEKVTEKYIVDTFIIPLKDAMPGFWNRAYRKLSPLCIDEATSKICKLMDTYYEAKTFRETLWPLLEYHSKYPEIVVAREFLAHAYEGECRWEEEIAFLEGIQETELMFYSDCMEDYYFNLAWAHGKLKQIEEEEAYYRKAIAKRKDHEWANNNLGWVLYQQERYAEAEKIFNRCVSKRMALPNSANGYLKVLMGEGKNIEAKRFIKETDLKIDKNIIANVKKLRNKDTDPEKTTSKYVAGNKTKSLRKSKITSQFSSEKALEDELEAELKAGGIIFGKRLKIYCKKGKYGRQYVIPNVGIVDILCEDYKGDLYVIELKKDSGYKDAYDQIRLYMEWFSNSKEFNDRNVYGIICLNSPSEALIKKVRKDNRVSLFEYRIRYSEIL